MPVTFTFGEMLSARSVIGTTLAELGETHENLWVLTPDIGARKARPESRSGPIARGMLGNLPTEKAFAIMPPY